MGVEQGNAPRESKLLQKHAKKEGQNEIIDQVDCGKNLKRRNQQWRCVEKEIGLDLSRPVKERENSLPLFFQPLEIT